ncbi:MAG: hypothetical protein C4K48_09440 [Candidatus Thorarchaeota archaeon]|nr:MAG: hypothetical protein C4K48_09440 [Candidatus Thorarchaeota archaeon]
MPFTPYHFGFGFFLGIIFFPFIDFTVVMIASVVLDLEPLTIIILDLPLPLHGFFHTYLGATIISLLLTVCIWPLRRYLSRIASILRLHQQSSFRHILPASLIGTYSHVFLDSILYAEMNPLYPLLGNPFLNLVWSISIYDFCVVFGLLGFVLYIVRFYRSLSSPTEKETQTSPFD